MKTAKNHGGKREGAGRPPKYPRACGDGLQYASAEAFLSAVVAGTEPADPVRVQAAKALLAYQAPRRRAPVKSPSHADLARHGELAAEAEAVEDFERKATAIRAKHKRKPPCPQ